MVGVDLIDVLWIGGGHVRGKFRMELKDTVQYQLQSQRHVHSKIP